MEKLIGENNDYVFYNWTDATDWARMRRFQLKAYNWHVMTVYNKFEELQGVYLIDSKTNELIHEFESRNLEQVCCMIDIVKTKLLMG